MTRFRITIQPEAERNISAIVARIAERSRQGARRWREALAKALDRLRREADSLPLAPEAGRFDTEVRDLLFKTRRGLAYRILFTVESDEVHILFVRGPGQDLVENPE